MDGDRSTADAGQHLAQRRQVEHVREALAVGLDEDREAAVARGDREQVRRALALLPERRPGAGSAPRQEERAGGVLPESGREQRAVGDLGDDEVLDLVGVREQQLLDAVELGLRQSDRDAVVGPDRLDLGPEAIAEATFERQRPGCVDPAAERRQHDEPPVAELVTEPFDDDAAVGRQGADGVALVLEVRHQVLGGPLVEIVAALEPGDDPTSTTRAVGEVVLDLPDEGSDRPAELDRSTDGVAVPERQLAGLARGPG